jgi:hypothetical protein
LTADAKLDFDKSAANPVSISDGLDPALRRPAAANMWVPAVLFAACLATQLYLLFFKSFNWDEFLHFSFIYRLRAETLNLPFQIFHLRALEWIPDAVSNLVDQMLVARICMWAMNLLTLLLIFGIARRFGDTKDAVFASFAYLTAGFVFTQAFSIRADPVVTATLMSALFLLAGKKLTFGKAAVIGALVGIAGMMTFKATFYAPCFAGLMWMKYRGTAGRWQFASKLAVTGIAALLAFGLAYLYHTWDFGKFAAPPRSSSSVSHFSRWLTSDLPFSYYIGVELAFAPLFFFLVLLAPLGWKKARLKADEKVALAGFIAPLATLLFYRNTFPYFFVFILAPPAVAIAPILGVIRKRFGNALPAAALSISPLALAILEPTSIIRSQRALIDYIHHEFPKKTGYLDYSGMIADYPRVITPLVSGNGIRLYYDNGDPVIAREIDRGNLPFIIVSKRVLTSTFNNDPIPHTFLPADLEAMRDNYVRQWGVLWRQGKQIPSGTEDFDFSLRRGGEFVADGRLTIDGIAVTPGTKIMLGNGNHVVTGLRKTTFALWRGDRLPTPPPDVPMDRIFTRF